MKRCFIVFLFVLSCFLALTRIFSQENTKGKTLFDLASPIRLAFSQQGNLLVTDYKLKMVLTVDRDTKQVIDNFAVDGKPLGIACDRGKIYVGNVSKSCIDVYNKEGKLQATFGATEKLIKKPTDIAIDSRVRNGRLFVVDAFGKNVKVFSLKGDLLYTIPETTPDPSILAAPTGIAADPNREEILVSDYGDSESIKPRIQIFDYNGNLVETISSKMGMMGKKFSMPHGLEIDRLSRVYLVDSFAGQVIIIDRNDGTVLKTLGGFGTDPGQLYLPLDLVVDESTKDIYVVNNLPKRIEIYRQGGIF